MFAVEDHAQTFQEAISAHVGLVTRQQRKVVIVKVGTTLLRNSSEVANVKIHKITSFRFVKCWKLISIMWKYC